MTFLSRKMVKRTVTFYFVASFPWNCWTPTEFPLKAARGAGYQTVPGCLHIDLRTNIIYLDLEMSATEFFSR